MKPIAPITAEQENHRFVKLIPGDWRFITSKVDSVEPVPVGSYVALVFRVTGYDPDCDGSLMARLVHVDREGTEGWETDCIGLYPDSEVVLDDPGELHRLAEGVAHNAE